MRPLALFALLALAACGADGPPRPPLHSDGAAPAISMTGSASAGMARDGG